MDSYSCKSPVLFLVFNRPDVTKRVFEAIRKAKPPRLYVAADGARENREGEAQLVEETRRIVTSVDWECEVQTLFRDENLGCGRAVSEAITWFFENEPEGIILEDDCLPNISFFRYMDLMLKSQRDELSVWSIAGTKFKCYPGSDSLLGYKSEVFFCWGWGTWQSRWRLFQMESSNLLVADDLEGLLRKSYWSRVIKTMKDRKVSSWAYLVALFLVKNKKYNVISPSNLIQNLGFEVGATHTPKAPRHYSNIVSKIIPANRSGIQSGALFDQIYYGLFFPFKPVRYLSLGLMMFFSTK